MLRERLAVGLSLGLAAVVLIGPSVASDGPSMGWQRNVEAGVFLTEGNRDSVQTRAKIGASGKSSRRTAEFSLRGEIGETDGRRNRERVGARYEDRFDAAPRWYIGFTADFLYDGVADLDYRVMIGPAVGVYLLRAPRQQLRAEAGPAYVIEMKGGDREEHPALRLAQVYEARVTKNARVAQGIEYVPELTAGNGTYLMKAHVELKADLDDQLGLTLRLEGDHDSRPAEGKEKRDASFSVALRYEF